MTPEPPRSAPLRIYLDTSDYSLFADIGYQEKPGIPAVLDFLREKKSQGLIEVRFSAVHLFEFLKDPSQRELALRKVDVVEELCGGLAFRYITDVFGREREALRSGVAPGSLVISDEGEWFHDINRNDSFQRKTILLEMLKIFPSLDRTSMETLFQAPRATAFFREEMKGLFKPKILIGQYLGSAEAQKLFGGLSAMEQGLSASLVQLREGLNGHIKAVLSSGEEVIKKARQSVKNLDLSCLSAPYLGLNELPMHLRESIGCGHFIPELPGLSTHCNIINAYIRDILYPSKEMKKIKESDAADILHATYLPYVDLYRTDGRFSSLVERLPKPSGVTVVPKLLQLPEAIEKALTRCPN